MTPTAPCDAHDEARALDDETRALDVFENVASSPNGPAEPLRSPSFAPGASRVGTLVTSSDPENSAPPGFATAPTTTAPGAAACSRPVNVSTSSKSAHASVNAATNGGRSLEVFFSSFVSFVSFVCDGRTPRV